MDRSGKCLCGEVTFTAKEVSLKDGSACHCGMCRRWSSGPLIAVQVGGLSWESRDSLVVFKSSEWAERGFCSKCGSGLFYRITAEGKHHGMTSVMLGSLDDQSGVTLANEWFIDKKPDAYTLAGERNRLTEAELAAFFGG